MAMVKRSAATAPPQPRYDDDEPTAPLTPQPVVEEAAAVPTRPARWVAVLGGLAFAAAGAAGAKMLHAQMDTQPFQVSSDVSAFAGLFVFAAAVERVLEPITRWMPGRRARDTYERLLAELTNRTPGVTVAAVAAAKAKCEQHRADRTVLSWGLATGVATALSAGGGFYLLRMLAENPGWAGVPTWVDALITGLVVGSGTKPLHDLLTRMQNGGR